MAFETMKTLEVLSFVSSILGLEKMADIETLIFAKQNWQRMLKYYVECRKF